MDKKIVITLQDEGFTMESDLEPADLYLMLSHIQMDMLLKMRSGQ